jgi:hypothetical protein
VDLRGRSKAVCFESGAVAFGVALVRGGSPSLLGLLTQNTALLGMLAAVSFLRLLRTPEAGSAGLPKGRGALWRTLGAVHVLGAVINLSAVFIMADRIGADGKPRLTFAGIGIYRPELFADIERGRPAKLAPLLRAAMAAGRVSGEIHTGRWVDVGTPERLNELDAEMRSL